MGGGAAMRAAAKVAGFGVVTGGIRGVSAQVFPISRKAAPRPVPSIVSSSGDLASDDLIVSRGVSRDSSSSHSPCFEIDDWEFAGFEEENREIDGIFVKPADNPSSRLVFGGPPSVQEAQEAISDLKDTLEKVYELSPASSVSSTGSFKAGHDSCALPTYAEDRICISRESIVAPPMPKHAIQAFKLLSESPAAQTVVSSLASDPKVWNAVMQNEALLDFIYSEKKSTNQFVEENFTNADCATHKSTKSNDESSCAGESHRSQNGFLGFVDSIKVKVVNMMSGLSDYLQSLFGGLDTQKTPAAYDESAKPSGMGGTLGASFMGLAIMAIIVVLLKRA